MKIWKLKKLNQFINSRRKICCRRTVCRRQSGLQPHAVLKQVDAVDPIVKVKGYKTFLLNLGIDFLSTFLNTQSGYLFALFLPFSHSHIKHSFNFDIINWIKV